MAYGVANNIRGERSGRIRKREQGFRRAVRAEVRRVYFQPSEDLVTSPYSPAQYASGNHRVGGGAVVATSAVSGWRPSFQPEPARGARRSSPGRGSGIFLG